MKSNGIKGVIQLILSVVLYFLIDNYLFWLLGKIGIHFTGDLYMIASFVKYLVICLFIYLIYRPQIHSSKNKFVKSLLVSGIFAVGTAVLLVFVNFLLHRLIGTFHVVGGYGFINYFDQAVSINTILSVIINVILILFSLLVIRFLWRFSSKYSYLPYLLSAELLQSGCCLVRRLPLFLRRIRLLCLFFLIIPEWPSCQLSICSLFCSE